MDTDIECVTLLGDFVSIEALKIGEDANCDVVFTADIGNCHSNRDEFLRLFWYDASTQCFSQTGIENNVGSVGSGRAGILERTPATTATTTASRNLAMIRTNHLTPYQYVDFQPANFSEAKFRIIWTFVIIFNVVLDILLFLSFLMCLIRWKKDYPKDDDIDIDDDGDGDEIKIDQIEVNAGGQSEYGDGDDSDESKMTKAKSKNKSKADGTSVVSSTRAIKVGSKRAWCTLYWLGFFLKNPLINPVIARHPRVPRFSRGLIHYTAPYLWVILAAAFLHVPDLQNHWFVSFPVSMPIIIIFNWIYTELCYIIHNKNIFILMIIVEVLHLLVCIGAQIGMYFIVEGLVWQQFK